MFTARVKAIIAEMSSYSDSAMALVDRFQINVGGGEVVAADAVPKRLPQPLQTADGQDEPTDPIETPQQVLDALRKEIRDLSYQVTALQDALLESGDADFTDEQHHHYVQQLTKNLMGQPYAMILSFYNRQFFEELPCNVRTTVAQTLCNVAVARGFVPEAFWTALVATNGRI